MNEMESQASLNILVVDDELALRETLTRAFSREGHNVRRGGVRGGGGRTGIPENTST